MKADLHMHTTFSDGVFEAKQIIKRAKDNGVDVMSITDHDVIKNVKENFEYAKEIGITYIPGIELSTLHMNRPVHVLGYFRDESYKSEELTNYFKYIKEGREKRAAKFIDNLKKFNNIDITYEEVYSYSNGIIARPHIAKAIVANYPGYDFDKIFNELIGDDSKAYVPSCEIGVKEGIDLLRRNNCLVILAHPTLLKPEIKEYVLKQDFDGFEAVYLRNKKNEEQDFRNLAKERNLIITAGGDFHGVKGDTTHADIGEIYIDGEDLQNFLNKFGNNK